MGKNSLNLFSMSSKSLVLSAIVMLFVNVSLFAQDDDNLGTEVIDVVKPYTPSISDAFKVKETPELTDSITTTKKGVKYNIFSVPVASTFTPAKGSAADVEKSKPPTLFENYATLGFGTFTSALAELYSNIEVSRTDNFGVFLRHNSSQGGISDLLIENKFYDTSLDLNYASRQEEVAFWGDVGVKHQLFNWYGLNPIFNMDATPGFLAGIDPEQNYTSFYVGGGVEPEDLFIKKAAAKIQFLSDSFSSSEVNITAVPEFSFPVNNLDVTVKGDLNYVSGNFARDYFNVMEIKYSHFNIGVAPAIQYEDRELTLSLGVATYLNVDSENSDTNFFIYPVINGSYRLVDELLIAYGGVEGGLQQNTYYDFKEENPFVSPTNMILPTNQVFNAFGGVKGRLSNSVGYNVRASYGKEENKALFVLNPYRGMISDAQGYELGNSFGVVYDEVNVFQLFGELKVEISENFSLGVNGSYNSYDTTDQAQAWNLPDVKASVFSNFTVAEKFFGGASIFIVGQRQALFTDMVGPTTTQEITLDSYIDANLHLGYRFTDRLNFFVKGSNLLDDGYQKWQNFPVQGIQALLGATYQFDW